MSGEQLRRLVEPFKADLIKQVNKGGKDTASYVEHTAVQQKLLAVIGPVDQHVVEILRGDYTYEPVEWIFNPETRKREPVKQPAVTLRSVVHGVILRCTYTIDGRAVTIEEVGDCENPGNWRTDGQRLKDAISDGVKRCAMRVGVGIHLYAKREQDFFLKTALERARARANESGSPKSSSSSSSAAGPSDTTPTTAADPSPDSPTSSPSTPSPATSSSSSSRPNEAERLPPNWPGSPPGSQPTSTRTSGGRRTSTPSSPE